MSRRVERAVAQAGETMPAIPTFRRGLTRLMRPRTLAGLAVLLGTVVALSGCATQNADGSTAINANRGSATTGVALIAVLTVISISPALLMMVTSFTRIVVVLSLLRNAIGVPQLPPNQVMLGLALFLSVFIMAPQWQAINQNALQPYLHGQIQESEAFDRGQQPIRDFMLRQTRQADLALFIKLSNRPQPNTVNDVPTYVVIPAFIISELKTAFQMGFILFVPFLIIDLVVSSALLAMGMMMLPPTVVSLPFKLLLFVLVNGWYLIAGSLVASFGVR
ncbi:MAG TPA: flagellar type III secretion system pore protein FliP [Dehalococcoidia bacterium]|nr:flagellar type III secretion system pore protein FliP [Dehalococcoidia bacterium]